jgi:hypothetical protein
VKYHALRVILGAVCTIGAGICICMTVVRMMEVGPFGSKWLPPIPRATDATVVKYHREQDRCYPVVQYVDVYGQTNVEELWSWSAEPGYSNSSHIRIHYLPNGLPGGQSRGHYPDIIGFTSIHAILWTFALSPFLIVPLAFGAYCLFNGISLRQYFETCK